MATNRRKTLGTVKCETAQCGRDIPVQESATGTVSYSCPYCGAVRHATGGSKAKRVLLASPHFKPETDDTTPPLNSTLPIADPVPVVKKKSSNPFDFSKA